jgi:hypothetical protein
LPSGPTRPPREAAVRNVTDYSKILAVIFETTGAVSVLHGAGPLECDLLEGVKGAHWLDSVQAPLHDPSGQ